MPRRMSATDRIRPQEIAIRPQPGPQTAFLATKADVALYGGAAGSGKTFALLMEPVRHLDVPGFGAVVFRRQYTEIVKEGGLWDEAGQMYPLIRGRPRTQPALGFTFPRATRVTFGHLNAETTVFDWHGSQIPLIEWDELTAFSKAQFFYMLSRNRSKCGVAPYMRATCNPDADSWVADFIEWFIDQETGYPIPERSGVLRYFIRRGDSIEWGDSPRDLADRFNVDERDALSFTFISAKITDNPALLQTNPRYLANLKALPTVERERLLYGNWKIRPAAGLYFSRVDATLLDRKPEDITFWVRSWDLAATEATEANPDPDWTVGALIGRRPNGRIVIADLIRVQRRAAEVRTLVHKTAWNDGRHVSIRLQQDPGQAGKDQLAGYIVMLSGFAVFGRPMTGDKITRALPFASQWQAGNVDVVRGTWNADLFAELEGFPKARHDDIPDALAEGFAALPLSGEAPDYSKGAPAPRPEP